MNRIDRVFRDKGAGVLNIYFTAGYPNLGDTGEIIGALEASGVDLVEIGVPYSDPLADGTTIQESGTRALENGMSLNLLFEQVAEVRKTCEIPLILMGYYNQAMQYGEEAFFRKCKAVGIDGVILPDLPLEVYERDYKSLLQEIDLAISFLITPQTEAARIRKIDELSTGFVYMVSSYALTGAKAGISADQVAYFERITRMGLKKPRMIGFGISDKETFDIACAHSNGAIIGSAFIKALKGKVSGELEGEIKRFVSMINGRLGQK